MHEIVSLRRENSKTFALGNARKALNISIGSIHYKDNYADNSEQWKDIDLTWEGNRITKAPYELTLEGNKITVRDKKTGDISTIELLEIGGKSIPAQTWEHSKGLVRAFDTDLEIRAGNSRVSFARILKSDTAPKKAKYRVTGKVPLGVSARDTEGELPVEWALKDEILTETLKPDRPVKYPIEIDPTLTIATPSKDTCLDEANPNDSLGNLNNMPVQNAGNDYAGLVQFAITWGTDIPSGATLTAATLSLYYWAWFSGDPVGKTYKAQRLLRLNWVEGTYQTPSTSGATWTNYECNTPSAWTAAGASSDGNDYTSTDEASDTVPADYGWMDWNVLSQVQTAQTGNIDIGFRIWDSAPAAAAGARFYTKECGDSDYFPKLVIEYYVTYELSVTDGVKVGDTPATQCNFQVSATDGIKAGDTPSTQCVFGVSVTDGVKVGDTPSIFKTIYLALTDGVKVGDSPTTILTINLSLTDGVKVGDWASILDEIFIEAVEAYFRRFETVDKQFRLFITTDAPYRKFETEE